MPFFTRRRTQAMFNDLDPHLDNGKCSDLLQRLENKRVGQVLPAEMELALLWGLLQLGEVEVEPEWFGNGRVPDAFSERLFPGNSAIVEIAAISDARLAQEDEMRRTASELCKAANAKRRGSGHHLFFQFGVDSGFGPEGQFRTRKVDPKFSVTDDITEQLAVWLKTPSDMPYAPIRIQTGKTDLTITWSKHKLSQHSNFFSSVPAEAYSLTNNPLHTTLKAKADQLKSESFNGIKCLLLADAGSTLLRHLDQEMRGLGAYSGQQIIQHFLMKSGCNLDVVCVFSSHRNTNSWSFPEKPLMWNVRVFVRPGIHVSDSGLKQLAAVLPRPRFEGYQARSLQQQDSYSTNVRGWYLGTHISTGEVKMTITMSARALLDLLAGRLSQDHFNDMIDMKGGPNRTNFFKLCLERGEVMSNIRIESGGLDEDDDRLIIEFSKDPSVSPLSRSKRNLPNNDSSESFNDAE